MTENTTPNPLQEVDQIANSIVALRKKPLLVLYYPDEDGMVVDIDIRDIYDEFRRRGLHTLAKIESIDVLIHTYGGSPNAAYRIGQVIRDFSKEVTFLVPYHSHSAGTLACFSANTIRLGAYAVVGPIDISHGGIELASIDYYMNFAERCRENMEEMLFKVIKKRTNVPSVTPNPQICSSVESELLVEMVRQVGALNVGRFFRERTLTGHYAIRLLIDYMFANEANKVSLSQQISNQFLFEFPAHAFDMDYHICREIGLPVFEMDENESDMTKCLVNKLDELSENGIICQRITDKYKSPFFRLYLSVSGGANNAGTM
jgi:hypothetical protein